MSAPVASEHFEDFLTRHNLGSSPTIEAERHVVHWSSEAIVIVQSEHARLTDAEFMKWPGVGFVLHLLQRAFEHLEAAIVAFVTGSGTSSECLSRATVELAISIEYVLAGHPETRLFAFFDHYLNGEQGRLRNWLRASAECSEPERSVHAREIEHRRSAITALSDLLGRLRQELVTCGVRLGSEEWPKIVTRFEAVGEALSYRTFYGRMSSQVHSDAEETIRFFVARVGADERIRERMAMETVWFSRLMLYFAVQRFLAATSAYGRYYGMSEAVTALNRGERILEEELQRVAAVVASA